MEGIRQFNNTKPDKHHIKAFSFVCGETSYCLNICVYEGKRHHHYDPKKGLVLDLILNKLANGLDFEGNVLERGREMG